ncbi:uncharacterized protein LOC128558855 [Mercenaria mercenaria]|uniref:uncharacterized protein LOC128558855 n=1 Tax=Mercenaria mercenaria TaxID=6596 RepID=UPI00234E72C6|nr:uncharacterized protein LOC128558855 [Mercenaria mercenaria]
MNEEDEIFASHNVVSLFTNTPIDKALEIIRDRLENDSTLKKRTLLTLSDIMELCEFILTTTYFQFRGNIFQQRFGTAMVNSVSPFGANLYVEWLEKKAIATAPVKCKPQLWKRYVDDILETINRGETQNLIDHLNIVYATDSIKFTHEEENNGTIPFLDTLIVRRPDGSVKLLVCNDIVTEKDDRKKAEAHIVEALGKCGYPKWSFQKVKKQIERKKDTKKKGKPKDKDNDQLERFSHPTLRKRLNRGSNRVLRKHHVATALKENYQMKDTIIHLLDLKNWTNSEEIIASEEVIKAAINETSKTLQSHHHLLSLYGLYVKQLRTNGTLAEKKTEEETRTKLHNFEVKIYSCICSLNIAIQSFGNVVRSNVSIANLNPTFLGSASPLTHATYRAYISMQDGANLMDFLNTIYQEVEESIAATSA